MKMIGYFDEYRLLYNYFQLYKIFKPIISPDLTDENLITVGQV